MQSRTDRAGRTEQDGQSRIGLRLGGQSQGQSSTDCYGFSDILRVATGFRMLFGCFAEQDRLTDVRTDYRALAVGFGESSRSQGTTTNPRGDVCGGVKWAALEIT
jgi:hypothetical protein